MSLTFLDSSTEHATAIAHDTIFIFLLRKLPTTQVLGRVRQEIDSASKRGLKGYFQIMHPRDGGPPHITDEERRAWVALAEAAKRGTDVGAIAILQGGFGGAALRAAVSTVLLLSRGKKPVRVFDRLDEASRWLAEQIGSDRSGPSEAEILAAAHGAAATLT